MLVNHLCGYKYVEPTIQCGRCGPQPLGAFGTRSNGRPQSWCRACTSAYGKKRYKRKRAYYLKANERNRRARRIQYLSALDELKTAPCLDCGLKYPPFCMDFDHRDSAMKRLDVSVLVRRGWSWANILGEIAKCDLVCANCHAERTYRRRWRDKPVSATASRDRKYVEAHQAAKSKPCADCGVQLRFYQMQFDHRDPSKKVERVSSLAHDRNMEKLLAEIAKCDVVCTVCHRRRTFAGVGPSPERARTVG